MWREIPQRHRNLGRRLGHGALAVALAAAALQSCTRQASTPEGDGVAPDRPPFSLLGDAPWPEPYAHDRLWLEAARGADIEQARLAQRESAHALLSAIEQGGSLGRTALDALEFAADRRGIRAELCALAARAEAATVGLLMDALLEALANAPANEETEDERADAACLSVLAEVQRRPSSSDADRDRALGAARLLAAH